jgi:rod shape determining protein RodA
MIAARGERLGHGGLFGYRWRDFDPYMLITTLVLIGFSVVAIWSATGADSLSLSNEGVHQFLFAIVGLALMLVIAHSDYRFLSTLAWILYVAAIASLVLVLVPGIGLRIAGSQRWFQIGQQTIQPSEFAKIATIVALAAFVSSRGAAMREFGNFVVSMLIVVLPMGLVFLQPDLGTTIVFGVIWLAMMLVTQTRKVYFAALALLSVPGFWVAWRFLFHDYQKERLLVSYNPSVDPYGAGFNIIQARISIGSGGWFGFGLHGGSQSQADLLRVRESDFIFAHASGMVGYLGMLALFVSFIILLWRCVGVVDAARDSFGQLLAIGISGILFFQAVVNIGMNVGLMPVTGITLPFISDGVSSLWSFLLAEGILQSILMHKRKLAFQRG